MRKETVLIAEDESAARRSLAGLLESEGFHVLTAENGEEALSALRSQKPDVALLDIRMPRLDGLSVLRALRESGTESAVIVMTAHGSSRTAIEAMKLGAFDYVAKPLDFPELLLQIHRAIDHRRLARELNRLRAQVPLPGVFANLVGHSPAMQRVYKLIGQVAPAEATVLVRGESGTGKELVVNAIHDHSSRSGKPLVKVNCAAIPDTLLESELFGYEKGAFTNAVSRRIGRFEEAGGGTLFLDEIGELAPALQAKLLRALQERTIERLGSNEPIHIDIRLVTATARNLEKEVSEGRFREDLYYRLNVVTVAIPPLRDRKQDIPALVQHFLSRSQTPASITPEALAMLYEYDWPGNVRELENVVERGIVLARSGVMTEKQIELGPRLQPTQPHWTGLMPLHEGFKQVLADAEKALIRRALDEARGSKTRAAELLRINRRLLYDKMREYGLD